MGQRAPTLRRPPAWPEPERAPDPLLAPPAPGPPRRRGAVVLYALTLAVGAGLVFLVQPMFARLMLPLLGGTPAVWTTAMLFFQSTLLLAYLYAHWTTSRLGARRQAALHLGLVALAVVALPIGVPENWAPPAAGSPVLPLLGLLTVSVGLPFFVVSATAPLLQSWLAATDHPDAGDPYFLYRASNVGSVLGLLSYPALVEPGLGLDAQRWLWTAGFGLLAALLAACATVLWRARAPLPALRPSPREPVQPVAHTRRARWVLLAFVPSSLMLAVTTALTTDVAPIPLLWVLPLSLYLVSFIVVFSRGTGTGRAQRAAGRALPVLLVALAGVLALGLSEPLALIGGVHLLAFFAVALVCHGELARDRPPAAQLTGFYAWISLGGALGGVLNVIVAPLAFNALTEYPLVLVLACLLLPAGAGAWREPVSFPRHLLAPLLVGTGVGVGLLATEGAATAQLAVCALAGLVCVLLARHPLRFGLGVSAAMGAIWVVSAGDTRVIHQDRSFFAVNRVESLYGDSVHLLRNGSIPHGAQIGGQGLQPVTYYTRTSPVAQLLDGLPDRSLAARAGIVGLGTGEMACLSRPGDRWTFFEVDPAVERLARDPRLFSYLRDCRGSFDVVLGDGRRSLQRQGDGAFGLLTLDAFSSDAIPIHLLTGEALALYRRKLAPHGVVAFHVSNRYLDLEPVLGGVAHGARMTCFAQDDRNVTSRTWLKRRSRWVAMARSRADLGAVPGDARWHPCRREAGQRAWSDDHADVIGALL